jgi:hypothetical protein
MKPGAVHHAPTDLNCLPGGGNSIIASDSHRQDERLARGMGTLILDECTLDWRLDDTDAGMTVTALLPVDA